MAKVKLNDVAIEARETWKQSKTDVPVVGLEHLEPDEIWLKRWDLNPDENTFTKGFKKGQLLFGRRRAYQKKMSVASCDGICSGDITVIAARPEKILPELLPFYLRTDTFFDFAVRGSGGSLSPRVKWSHISDYEFDLPPMDEQKKLAELLWAANDLKEKYKKAITATDEMLKAKFREMFGEHKHNTKVSLGDICSSIVRGPYGSALKVSFFVPKSTPDSVKVYEQKNAIQSDAALGEYYISKERYNALSRFRCCPGDFIMSCAGTVGCVYQLPAEAVPGIINQALCKFTLNGKMLPVAFLVFMQNMVSSLDMKGSAMKNLCAVGILKNMPIYLPPLALQREFVAIAENAEAAKTALKKSIADIDQVMKGLING